MDLWSISPVSEKAREIKINKKLLLRKKPAIQPNPIIYRKSRRRSAAGVSEKRIEHDKISPYNKAYFEDENKEWITESEKEYDEKGNQELDQSIQKSSKNSSYILSKKWKKKSSHIDKLTPNLINQWLEHMQWTNYKYITTKARQPNPIIYRKSRRRSAAGVSEKRIEPDKISPYNKAYIKDESEEWITDTESEKEHNSVVHDEKGNQELDTSMQKSSENSSHILNKRRKKKSIHIDKANKECSVSSSSSHVINMKGMIETSDHGQGLTKELDKSASICKTFIQFCSTEIICPEEDRAALAVKLYGVQAALLSTSGNPFDNLSQSISSSNSSKMTLLSLGQASTWFLPSMIWTGMFILSFCYTVMVVWSLAFRVPIISMLCLALVYCLSLLVAAASGFHVICGTFRLNGILFASLGVLGFVLLLLFFVMLMLFASWRRIKQDEGAK